MEQFLLNIKLIKAMSLESHVLALTHALRGPELHNLRLDMLLRALSIELNALFIITATTSTVLLLWHHRAADFATILAVMALFRKLRHQLNMIPISVAAINDGRVSMGRLQRLLRVEVGVRDVVVDSGDAYHVHRAGEDPTRIAKGSLVRLQEADLKPAQLALALSPHAKVALCSHSPWLLGASIRDNILFGLPLHPHRYQRALSHSQLLPDLAHFEAGDGHLVTGHGANLSGGQRARLALARAMYSEASVWVLDNLLKSMDAGTGRMVLRACILGRPPTVTVVYYGELDLPGSGMCASDEPSGPGVLDDGFKSPVPETRSDTIPLALWRHWLLGAGGLALLLPALLCKALLHGGRLGNDTHLARMSFTPSQLRLYILSCGLQILLPLLHSLLFYFCGLRASSRLHAQVVASVFRAPLLVHTRASLGLLLNRMGKEQEYVDLSLPIYAGALSTVVASLLFTTYGILSKHLAMAAPLAITFILYAALATAYRRGTRGARRAESASRGLLCDHALDLTLGHPLIRGLHREPAWTLDIHRLALHSCGTRLLLVALQVWFTLRIKVLGHVATLAVGVLAALCRMDGAMAALAFSYSVELPSMALWTVRQFAQTESHMVAYERIHELTRVYAAEEDSGTGCLGLEKAPVVQVKGLSLALDGQQILSSVSLVLEAGQRTAIVGRTGSGKSTLLLALLRLYDHEGDILIDGLPTTRYSKQSLRRAVSHVAQEPLIFPSQTLSYNLDPLGHHSDHAQWRVLKALNIKLALDHILTGTEPCCLQERICLARGLLPASPLLLLDEPLASLPHAQLTAMLQSSAFRELLRDRTVVVVTHRREWAEFCGDSTICIEDGRIQPFV